MSVITITFDLKDDMTAVVTDLLRQFPKGSRVQLAISEVPPATPVPSLDDYRGMIVAFAGRFQGVITRNATDFRNILPTLQIIEP